ncbi:hypothetical protein ACC848_42840, partial [Rhizobium johnstonii]
DVRYRAASAALLADYVAVDTTSVDGAFETARVRVGDARSLKRAATRLGGELEILAPESARQSSAAWAEAGLAQYR